MGTTSSWVTTLMWFAVGGCVMWYAVPYFRDWALEQSSKMTEESSKVRRKAGRSRGRQRVKDDGAKKFWIGVIVLICVLALVVALVSYKFCCKTETRMSFHDEENPRENKQRRLEHYRKVFGRSSSRSSRRGSRSR